MPGDWSRRNQFTYVNESSAHGDEIYIAARLNAGDRGAVIAVYKGSDYEVIMGESDDVSTLLSRLRDFMARFPVGASLEQASEL